MIKNEKIYSNTLLQLRNTFRTVSFYHECSTLYKNIRRFIDIFWLVRNKTQKFTTFVFMFWTTFFTLTLFNFSFVNSIPFVRFFTLFLWFGKRTKKVRFIFVAYLIALRHRFKNANRRNLLPSARFKYIHTYKCIDIKLTTTESHFFIGFIYNVIE